MIILNCKRQIMLSKGGPWTKLTSIHWPVEASVDIRTSMDGPVLRGLGQT